jgi:inhibitor of cysteine peptidase
MNKNIFSKSSASIILISVVFVLIVVFLISFTFLYKKKAEDKKVDQTLAYAISCEQLTDKLQDFAYPTPIYDDRVYLDAPTKSVEQNSSSQGQYFTPTNVQVMGIDEGDIVKTDGTYLYFLSISNKKFSIVNLDTSKDLKNAKKISEIDLSKFNPSNILLYKNRLVIFSQRYDIKNPMDDMPVPNGVQGKSVIKPNFSTFTNVAIYDISSKETPEFIKDIDLEGNLVTNRLKNSYIYFITNNNIRDVKNPIPLIQESDNLKYIQANPDNSLHPSSACDKVAILDEENRYPSMVSIAALNLDEDILKPVVHNYVGNAGTVYMANDNLYLTSNRYTNTYGSPTFLPFLDIARPTSSIEETLVNKFSYKDDNVDFIAKTSFEGHLLNQFSLDEYRGNLRLGATKNNPYSGKPDNFLNIYDENLNKLSDISNLARGETIYSVRFENEIATVVTFKRIDPLFVFDLSDAKKPILKGELKIPGYSNYLHFINDHTIIGFGKDAEDISTRSDFAYYQGLKLAIFDITDMNNPKQISELILGDRGSDSPALTDHKAFVYDPKNSLIMFPASIAKISEGSCKNISPVSCYGTIVSQGAQIVKIDKDNKLSLQKEITHFTSKVAGYSYYSSNEYVERSLIVGDNIITISDDFVKINSIESQKELKTIDLKTFSEKEAVQQVKSIYPVYKDYPDTHNRTGFGSSTLTLNEDNGWYVTFMVEGSGRPIISAKCFFVDSSENVKVVGEKKSSDKDFSEIDVKTCKNKLI